VFVFTWCINTPLIISAIAHSRIIVFWQFFCSIKWISSSSHQMFVFLRENVPINHQPTYRLKLKAAIWMANKQDILGWATFCNLI
jgi:hypothetical protein